MNEANLKILQDVDSAFKLILAGVDPLLAPSTVMSMNREIVERVSRRLSLSAPNIPEAVRLFGESIREQLQQRSASSILVLEIPRAVLTWIASQTVTVPTGLFSAGYIAVGLGGLLALGSGVAYNCFSSKRGEDCLSRFCSFSGLGRGHGGDNSGGEPGAEAQTPRKSSRSKRLAISSPALSGNETDSTRASSPAPLKDRGSVNRQRAKLPRIETPEAPEKKVTRSGSTLTGNGKVSTNKRTISAKLPLKSQKKKLKTSLVTADAITGSMAAMCALPGAATDHQNSISPKHCLTPQLVKRDHAGLM